MASTDFSCDIFSSPFKRPAITRKQHNSSDQLKVFSPINTDNNYINNVYHHFFIFIHNNKLLCFSCTNPSTLALTKDPIKSLSLVSLNIGRQPIIEAIVCEEEEINRDHPRFILFNQTKPSPTNTQRSHHHF